MPGIQNEKIKMQNNNLNIKTDVKSRAYLYALEVIKFLDSLDQKDFAVHVLSKQLLRSATSVGANIIEAQAGSSRKDFTNFLNYSLKSANESKFWLGLLRDSGKAVKQSVDSLFDETVQLSNILASSIITLKRGK